MLKDEHKILSQTKKTWFLGRWLCLTRGIAIELPCFSSASGAETLKQQQKDGEAQKNKIYPASNYWYIHHDASVTELRWKSCHSVIETITKKTGSPWKKKKNLCRQKHSSRV